MIRNQTLLNEIQQNQHQHEIFEKLNREELLQIKGYLEQKYPNDLVVSFDRQSWNDVLPFLPERTDAHLPVWNHYASFRILQAYQKRQQKEGPFPLGLIDKAFESHNPEYYAILKSYCPTYQDVLSILNASQVGRLHLFLYDIHSCGLCDALAPYLSSSFQKTTMLYLSPNIYYTLKIPEGFPQEKEWIWQAYDYLKFNPDGEIKPSLKHHQKQKRKLVQNEK